MRYNPATDRAVSIEEIAEQCRRAILQASVSPSPAEYKEILKSVKWESDLARV